MWCVLGAHLLQGLVVFRQLPHVLEELARRVGVAEKQHPGVQICGSRGRDQIEGRGRGRGTTKHRSKDSDQAAVRIDHQYFDYCLPCIRA